MSGWATVKPIKHFMLMLQSNTRRMSTPQALSQALAKLIESQFLNNY